MGNFGVLVVSVRSRPRSNSSLEEGRVRSVRALACGLNLVANHESLGAIEPKFGWLPSGHLRPYHICITVRT